MRTIFKAHSLLPCLLAVTFVAPTAARAVPLATEQFAYTLNAGINGQNGGSGFAGPWAYSSQVSGSTSTAFITTGLAFSDLPVSGNAVRINVVSSSSGGFGDTVYLRRAPGSVPAAGQTMWYRYLFHMDQNITANNFVGGMDIDDAENVSLYSKFGAFGLSGVGNGRGGVNVDTGVVSAPAGSPSLSDTGTYLMIAKFTDVNSAFGVARTGTWWALSVADFDAIKLDGITEAELNAHNRQTATETVFPTTSQPLDFALNDRYELRGSRPPISNAFQHYDFDEIYAGTSFGDLALPVPEPAAGSLMICGLALAWLKRRPGR